MRRYDLRLTNWTAPPAMARAATVRTKRAAGLTACLQASAQASQAMSGRYHGHDDPESVGMIIDRLTIGRPPS